MRRVVFSVYQGNIPSSVLCAQSAVVRRFLPQECEFVQFAASHHALGIDEFLDRNVFDSYVILDIDCIPLNHGVIDWMFQSAAERILVGCAQRANHIQNGKHLYAGPCGLAFSRELRETVGRPSFVANARGDVAEEFTYACERHNVPVRLLWPTYVRTRRWDLFDEWYFGNGTIYADSLYHEFEIGRQQTTGMFLEKCEQVLRSPGMATDRQMCERRQIDGPSGPREVYCRLGAQD